MSKQDNSLAQALWRLYRRPELPRLWVDGGNLPWDDPSFSQRMLREHLDEMHGAASRVQAERQLQLDWLWQQLYRPFQQIWLDITCGPGLYAVALAQRGVPQVVGLDFAPAAIAYARDLAKAKGLSGRCTFYEADIRAADGFGTNIDVALLLYGQLAVFPRDEARAILQKIAASLAENGRLCIELLDQTKVDKTDSNWWFTDDQGLWGDGPFLHLGERFWLPQSQSSVERFYIVHLESGQMDEVTLCDQTYAVAEMVALLKEVGFSAVDVFPAWDGLPLYDADEWTVYIATK